MASHIGRRKFLAMLGGAAAAWPLAARAQQPMPVIGFLNSRSPDGTVRDLAAFRKGLAKAGYVEGHNVAIEYRWADGKYEQLPALAADLVRRKVAVIAATGGEPSALAAKAATATIPIVFTSAGDPVKLGLVTSLNRPDNATGVHWLLGTVAPKRLELLRELVPKASVIIMLVNPAFPSAEHETKEVLASGRTLGLQIHIVTATNDSEIDAAFGTLAERRIDALLVGSDAFFVSRRARIIAAAANFAVPVMYFARDFPEDGGLISYGTSIADAYHQVGIYSGQILNGTKPSDLPVVQPTKIELVINLKTAKALGLQIPDRLLALADEVIE